jgi:hypothetical protein
MSFTTFMFTANHSSTGLLSKNDSETTLLSNNNFENITSLLTSVNNNDGFDFFGVNNFFGSIDFFNEGFFADASQAETIGSVALNSSETIGSVAFASVGFDAGISTCACGGGDFSGGGGSFNSFC